MIVILGGAVVLGVYQWQWMTKDGNWRWRLAGLALVVAVKMHMLFSNPNGLLCS
jgi:hypothetical protein